MWTVRGVNQPDHISVPYQICKYKTAQYLFCHECIPTLVSLFRLPPESREKSKAHIIFLGTGDWDVMRPQDQQTGTEPLTREEASKMMQRRTIPEFIVAATQQLVKKKQQSLWGCQKFPGGSPK
jgi:hypothetical protein